MIPWAIRALPPPRANPCGAAARRAIAAHLRLAWNLPTGIRRPRPPRPAGPGAGPATLPARPWAGKIAQRAISVSLVQVSGEVLRSARFPEDGLVQPQPHVPARRGRRRDRAALQNSHSGSSTVPSVGPRRSARLAMTTARRPGRDWYRVRVTSPGLVTMAKEYTLRSSVSNIQSIARVATPLRPPRRPERSAGTTTPPLHVRSPEECRTPPLP